MLKTRLIPCLLLKNGLLVRSEKFSLHQIIGNPINEVQRFNTWAVDELIYIDISEEGVYDLRRDDMKVKNQVDLLSILDAISQKCFMPLTFGGRIRTLDDIRQRLLRGADKVTVNSVALADPSFITQAANVFGSQCIVVSIDFKKKSDGSSEVFVDHGRKGTGWDPVAWAKEAEKRGAGEIFLNSIDRDGTAEGYDVDVVRAVAEACTIPVIACGGVGRYEHFAEGVVKGKASAVSAANIFHFKELSDRNAKRVLKQAGVAVRH